MINYGVDITILIPTTCKMTTTLTKTGCYSSIKSDVSGAEAINVVEARHALLSLRSAVDHRGVPVRIT